MHCSQNYGTTTHTPHVYRQPLRLMKKDEDYEVISHPYRYKIPLSLCGPKKMKKVLHFVFDHKREGNGS